MATKKSRVAKGVTKEEPIGPNGEFQTYGHCKNCNTWGPIYLYGELKGLCFHCSGPSKMKKLTRKIKGKIKNGKRK